MNVAGMVIPPGGFEPVLSVFDSVGNLIAQDTTGGTAPLACGGRNIDPISHFCLDAFVFTTLTPGHYTVILSEFDNVSNGSQAAGFSQQGAGDFTGPEFRGSPGAFVLFDGTQRTSSYALDIAGITSTVPEPNSFPLILVVITVAAATGRAGTLRRRKSGKDIRWDI
jgi:hypothetical protein